LINNQNVTDPWNYSMYKNTSESVVLDNNTFVTMKNNLIFGTKKRENQTNFIILNGVEY